jgi:hypothetical protein
MKVNEELKEREAQKNAINERRYFDTTTSATYIP